MSRAAVPDFTDSAAAADEWNQLAPAIAGRPAMRTLVRRKGRATYPPTSQRPLTAAAPGPPAAVMLWDSTGRLPVLALDFDAKHGTGPRTAAADAHTAVDLLADAGLHPVADRGPTGGWHVYARLPQPAAAWQVRQAAAALQNMLPSLDPGPLLNPVHGCIRPPGAAHKSGGYQRLVGPLTEAAAALAAAPAADSWQRLCQQINAATAEPDPPTAPDPIATAAVGTRRRAIAAAADTLARTGKHPTRSFPSASEARFSVICHAVNAGWSLADIEHAMRGGWQWLHHSYGTKHHSALARDFLKAKKQRTHTRANRSVRTSDTSQHNTQRGALPLPVEPDPHLALRRFTTFIREHTRRNHHSPTLRAVIHAVIWAGHVQGRLLVNVGVRSLAEQAGLHFDTVAEMLHELAAQGLISRVTHARGTDADVWRIHTEHGDGFRPARGRRFGLRRVFRTLGGHLVAEVYETLAESRFPLTTAELGRLLGYDRRRIHEALRLLAGWELSQRTRDGWLRGPADPEELAQRLGGYQHWKAQHDQHQAQRAQWAATLRRRQVCPAPGQLNFDAEFAAVSPDDQAWIEDFAAGGPPHRAHSGQTRVATPGA